ncbi:MAG: ABC transporter substrate-binding protein, partial [Hyphomicrobiales bacterium]|nr:ABC transporter substrate-binding protein [Hyphomicrobiales bacterium]
MNTTSLKAARWCASIVLTFGLGASAARADDPGVTPTSVTIGQTAPLSGPVSAYSTFSRASLAYFDMINARGGVVGRKVKLISVDDSYSPPKTVEQTRKLVEGDQVFAIFAPVGGASAKAVQKYLNGKDTPQFLIQSTLPSWNNPKEFPWSIAGLPATDIEVSMYARWIKKNMPKA